MAMRKLVREMLDATSPVLSVKVLEIDNSILERAEGFMMHASKYKFGSQYAIIAAIAIINSTDDNPMFVVTSDRALRAAMQDEKMNYIVPGC